MRRSELQAKHADPTDPHVCALLRELAGEYFPRRFASELPRYVLSMSHTCIYQQLDRFINLQSESRLIELLQPQVRDDPIIAKNIMNFLN